MRSRSPYRPTPSSISYSFGPGPMTPVIKALIIANNTLIQELEHAWRESPPRRKRGW